MRMTWVATGTSCKETGQRVGDCLVSYLAQSRDEFVLEEFLVVVVDDNVPADTDAAGCPGELEGVLVFLLSTAREGTLTCNNTGGTDHHEQSPTSMATKVEE